MDTDGPSAAAGEGRPPSQTRPSPAAESQPAPSDTGAQRATGGGPLTARTNQQQQQQQAPGTKVTRKKFEHVKVRASEHAACRGLSDPSVLRTQLKRIDRTTL